MSLQQPDPNDEQYSENDGVQTPSPEPMARGEARMLAVNAMLAGLFVGLLFVAGGLLFILFCVFVWFR